VRAHWVRVGFPRMMIQITTLAAAFALVTSAIRNGEMYHGGSRWINVALGVIVLAVGFPLARSLANDIR
jgi:hypothetical protein